MPSALPALVVSHAGYEYHSMLPRALVTGSGSDPRPRLRVDNAQTSFFENRQFRMYHEFTLAAGTSVWLRWASTIDFNVLGRDVILNTGQMRYALYSGGTPSGVWTAKTLYHVNNYADAPPYSTHVTVSTGGSLSGGTELDIMLANAGTGGNSSSATVGLLEVSLAAGTYYVEIRNTGSQSCTGMYRVYFEEFAANSPIILIP